MAGSGSLIQVEPGPAIHVKRVRCATIRHTLDTVIHYGRWTITHREFALVRVDTDEGVSGFAYGLTRDGPIATIVQRSIGRSYEQSEIADPRDAFRDCRATNNAVFSSGTGLRALSLVDIAVWDAFARFRGLPIARMLGGRSQPRPATSIIGYPPTMPPEALADEVTGLHEQGWRRFKAPISSNVDLTLERMEAARTAARGGWLGFDFNYSVPDIDRVCVLEQRMRHLELGWIEDVLPPGDAHAVAEVKRRSRTPIAIGDDQGGAYFPEALLALDAIDVLRVDVTANGGITGLAVVVEQARQAGVPISPHMFPHFHTRILDGFGVPNYPAEWGIPGTGVHPMDDCLEQPVLTDGVMAPLHEGLGFDRVINPGWLSQQDVDDPLGVLLDLPAEACIDGSSP